jgi:hypothetical protein
VKGNIKAPCYAVFSGILLGSLYPSASSSLTVITFLLAVQLYNAVYERMWKIFTIQIKMFVAIKV